MKRFSLLGLIELDCDRISVERSFTIRLLFVVCSGFYKDMVSVETAFFVKKKFLLAEKVDRN